MPPFGHRFMTLLILGSLFWFLTARIYQKFQGKYATTYYDYRQSESERKNDSVRILVWSTYFGRYLGNETVLRKMLGLDKMHCRSWCEIVGDKELMNTSDALVWHGWPSDMNLNEVPKQRNPEQPWVWWTRESPYLTIDGLEKFNGIFNWTMTYRRDSDVFYPYAHLVPLSSQQSGSGKPEKLEWLAKEIPIGARKKLIAGVISKCDTPGRREKLIELLKRHGLAVDIYGKCGSKVTESDDIFWERLQAEYKFYLAFENALCHDYVTEKLWRTLQLGIVPVVYGEADYYKVTPPNSFIDARDFNSTKELVEYIWSVSNDTKEYSKYFEWRKSYRILGDGDGFCTLCIKVRDERRKRFFGTGSRNVYTDLFSWWTTAPTYAIPYVNQGSIVTPVSACSEPKL